ncbi:helix-turn-helix domain-containing protein [Nonomuraea wenchangensis]|uniref:helix-turn-helix domain-containing protein n=1 Tax=Nonomuraea wenchangensis TaxID=568860 RepID=UPI000B8207EA|nr:helix-turn-helix domain-containing protein [Nonomuraea wenchangensis]
MCTKRDDDGPLWGVQQVADYLNVSKRWIYREGPGYGLPAFKIGRHLRYKPAEVRAWLTQQRFYGK